MGVQSPFDATAVERSFWGFFRAKYIYVMLIYVFMLMVILLDLVGG